MSLSNKIKDEVECHHCNEGIDYRNLFVGDVREAIKEIITKIEKFPCDIGIKNDLIQDVRKVFGEELTK